METDNVYCSEQDRMLKIKPEIDMSDSYGLEYNKLESVDEEPDDLVHQERKQELTSAAQGWALKK